ncbi:MAG: hypothetical protein JRI47_06630 [Deltaproteobacteria bacterium]|nr:hypothetical protein [Deltaproteobacteria bacterium]
MTARVEPEHASENYFRYQASIALLPNFNRNILLTTTIVFKTGLQFPVALLLILLRSARVWVIMRNKIIIAVGNSRLLEFE